MGVIFLIFFSQINPVRHFISNGINIDIGRFKATDTFTLCELYISFPYSELFYKREDSLLKSHFKMCLSINTIDSSEVADRQQIRREFNKISYISSYEEAEARNLHILDKIDLFLEPGKYEIKLEIVSDSTTKSVQKVVEIEPPRAELYLSDIELATSIEPANPELVSGREFVKNGVKIIPNPQAVFGKKYPTLYAYTEIYNLKLNSKYEVQYNIFNETGDLLYTLPTKTLSANSKDITEVGGVDVSAFKEGAYILKLKVTQDVGTTLAVAQKEKKFYVIKEDKVVSTTGEEIKFTAEELEYYHLIKYIAPPSEVNFYNNLPEEAKHKYLINFWKKVGMPVLHELIERIKYADTHFSSVGKKGRDTDRGRIWIKYGKPDEIEKFSFDRTYHACEKWTYFGGGGKKFIFVDKADDNRYDLMYSSIPEEPTAPDYRQWVNPEAL